MEVHDVPKISVPAFHLQFIPGLSATEVAALSVQLQVRTGPPPSLPSCSSGLPLGSLILSAKSGIGKVPVVSLEQAFPLVI